jgi:hypothetical protein
MNGHYKSEDIYIASHACTGKNERIGIDHKWDKQIKSIRVDSNKTEMR